MWKIKAILAGAASVVMAVLYALLQREKVKTLEHSNEVMDEQLAQGERTQKAAREAAVSRHEEVRDVQDKIAAGDFSSFNDD